MGKFRTMIQHVALGSLLFSAFAGALIPSVMAEQEAIIAEQPAPAVIDTSDPELVPGQVIVKYKAANSTFRTFFRAQSVSPKFVTVHFAESININDKIKELLLDPNVEYAEPVYRYYASGSLSSNTVTQSIYSSTDPEYRFHWGKTVTELTYAADQTTLAQRSQVVVAVVDSGVDMTHPGLQSSIVTGYDYINNDSIADDDNGHGTHVAGIIAANAHSSSIYSGVSPGSKIMPVKVLNNAGQGTTATIISGIQYAIDHHADIINLSLGSPASSQALHDVIKDAVNHNIVVVAASGNESNHWIGGEAGQYSNPDNTLTDTHRKAKYTSYPAAYDEVISVGAIEQLSDKSLTVADFSNVGRVDVVAPGVEIYSTKPQGTYGYLSGTSQATPFVAGFAALLKAYNHDLKQSEIKAIIRGTAGGSLGVLKETEYEDFHPFPYLDEDIDFEMAYGKGLINGRVAFQSPRPVIAKVQADLSQSRTVTFDVYLKNLLNQTVTVNSGSASLVARVWSDDTYRRSDDPKRHDDDPVISPLQFNNGYTQGIITFPQDYPVDVYYYYFYAEIKDSDTQYRRSNYEELIDRPAPPTASLASSTYIGTQQVALSSSEQDATIYYYLKGVNSTPKSGAYTSALEIKESSYLSAAAFKNHLFSSDAEYYYTINPPPRSGGGGGGGFIPAAAPVKEITTDASGIKTLVVKPDKKELLEQTKTGASSVIVDATSAENTDVLSLELSGEVFKQAGSNGKSLLIKGNEVEFQLSPDTIHVSNDKDIVLLYASESKTELQSANTKPVTNAFDFTLSVNGSAVAQFAEPVQVSFKLAAQNTVHPQKLGIYYFNDAAKQWELIGGSFNNDSITAALPHFSKYAVFEKNLTFADIQGHWAQPEIESMAGRQIVNGMTDDAFQPDVNITRAQFVALLARSLKLTAADQSVFKDVPSDAWYRSELAAAYQAKLVSGISDNEFAPDSQITREQMATLLVNAYAYLNHIPAADLTTGKDVAFADEAGISDWAKANVRLASGLGLMNGVYDGVFQPAGAASRAQATVVLYRLLGQK